MLDYDLAVLYEVPTKALNQAVKRNIEGVTMLASILKSDKAIEMNIFIVRAFIALRQFALQYKELADEIQEIKRTVGNHGEQLGKIYVAIEALTATGCATASPAKGASSPEMIRGASSLYSTGVTTRVRMVELSRPPMITSASGEYSGLLSATSGIRPPIAVSVVRMMGTNRVSPASWIASSRPMPPFRSWSV